MTHAYTMCRRPEMHLGIIRPCWTYLSIFEYFNRILNTLEYRPICPTLVTLRWGSFFLCTVIPLSPTDIQIPGWDRNFGQEPTTFIAYISIWCIWCFMYMWSLYHEVSWCVLGAKDQSRLANSTFSKMRGLVKPWGLCRGHHEGLEHHRPYKSKEY